jgi:hypothetical protein
MLPLQKSPFWGPSPRQANGLSLDYQITGDCSTLSLPDPVAYPTRQDHLWQGTCFECFLAVPQRPEYWEINLSPDHHWNVYRLDDYRQGLRPEPAIQTLPFHTHRQKTSYRLSIQLPLAPFIAPSQPLQVGITAVIANLQDHTLSYWALTHPGTEPDFHRRDSFGFTL